MLPTEKGVGLAHGVPGDNPSPTKPIGQQGYEMGQRGSKYKMESPLNACSQAVTAYCKGCRYHNS